MVTYRNMQERYNIITKQISLNVIPISQIKAQDLRIYLYYESRQYTLT